MGAGADFALDDLAAGLREVLDDLAEDFLAPADRFVLVDVPFDFALGFLAVALRADDLEVEALRADVDFRAEDRELATARDEPLPRTMIVCPAKITFRLRRLSRTSVATDVLYLRAIPPRVSPRRTTCVTRPALPPADVP